MCYSVAQMKKREYDAALRGGVSGEELDKIKRDWLEAEEGEKMPSDRPYYHVSGFEHPRLYAVVNDNGLSGARPNWGLIPSWVKDEKQALDLSNQTLNARGESIFEKPSFRESATKRRCIILVDGFYEYHHVKSKTFPFFIERTDDLPFILGGLWSEWVNKDSGEIVKTASIVTTVGNELMTKIHNNPKATGPRMPLILEPDLIMSWLTAEDKTTVEQLIRPYDQSKMKAHPVGRLKGKDALIDSEECTKKVEYPELPLLEL